MELISISYSEFPADSRHWTLKPFDFNNINLIVGKNAEGKSRTLSLIYNLSNIILMSSIPISNGCYDAEFKNGNNTILYSINILDSRIMTETLTINDEDKIIRKSNGTGTMFNAMASGNKSLKFELPMKVPAISRLDKLQYPYLQELHDWALNVRLFKFGTDLGQSNYLIINNGENEKEYDIRQTSTVVDLFYKGYNKYQNKFKDAIIGDFNKLGYEIDDIKLGKQQSFVFQNLPSDAQSLFISESNRKGFIEQLSISAGMFRALAIIMHFNFSQLSDKSGTILIDDIGEGLDYDRSTKLITLLIEKASKNKIQLIMSTNDRFVMNKVPLEYWQILFREGGVVKVYNYKNSETTFNDFKYTGLNNFDFFTTGFFKDGFSNA